MWGEGTEEEEEGGRGGNERAQTKTEWVSMKALTFTEKKKEETNEMRENNTSDYGRGKLAMDGDEERVNEESRLHVNEPFSPD